MVSKIIYYCKEGHDPVATTGPVGSKECTICKQPMKTIGWIEDATNEGPGQEAGQNA